MRIKTQFLTNIISFSIILIIVGASVGYTQNQINYLNYQEEIALGIQTGASDLNYISNNYFLYQENSSINSWQRKYDSLKEQIIQLNSTNPREQELVRIVSIDLEHLNTVFIGVSSFLASAPRNVSVRILPSFQTQWNRMVVQTQGLAFDSQQLAQAIRDQSDQTITTNTSLTIALLALFGAFFISIYLLISRNTLKSISTLKKGIKEIGAGNLDLKITAGNGDEISEISGAVNQMSYDLKNVTTSKIELEKEIEERKKTEKRLQETADKLSTAVKSIGGGTWDLNLLTGEQVWTEEMYNVYGIDSSETMTLEKGMNAIHPEDRRLVEQSLATAYSNLSEFWSREFRIINPKRRIVWVAGTGKIFYDQTGKPTRMIGVNRDITDRKQTQQLLENHLKNLEKMVEERTKQLKDSERLAAIGATAGMVGHDIRNPLQAIVGDLFLARQELKDTPDSAFKENMLENIDAIERNIFYINKIVADLQDFAKPINPHFQESELKPIIEQTLTNSAIPQNITTQLKVSHEVKKINVDPDLLKRVLSNLTLNAIQAMPNGGKLTIQAFKKPETGATIMTIQDTGVGIPDEVKNKLFTPMFTTKSKGQGFGLAVCKRLIEAMKGTITFESENGEGTKFIIELPMKENKH
jgi:PAS domain S-box-containing protein